MKRLSTILAVLLFALPFTMNAQSLSGKVMGGGEAVIGANISVAGTSTGTVTDIEGNYTLSLGAGSHSVNVTYIGFAPQTFNVTLGDGESQVLNITLLEGVSLNDVVITGSRTAPRSSTDTPLPIDVVSGADLMSTGQNSFDKALTYRIPSFNSVNTPVNDATALLDPYEIRNMGPSRTLILINGKRKNTSALLYVQTSPGRGETGADISAIPPGAIERVEILRDGASAQYGSDAIAGVMNIILKEDSEHGSVTLTGGMTSEGDGETIGFALNNGAKLGENGFLNYTIDLSKRELANRPGTVDAEGEAGDFGASIESVREFLGRHPDAGNVNGSPETTAAKFAVNMGIDLSENSELYANAAYVYKKVNSFANYRTPYWRTIDAFPYLADFFPGDHPTNAGGYDGYVPTFDGLLNDYNATLGVRTTKNGWISDASLTVGGNEQTYRVINSHNRNDTQTADGFNKYRENSPVEFDPGGTRFTHVVGNIDVTRRLSDMVGIAFGSEFRSENFTVIEGIESSYEDGGADSFAGNEPKNSGKFNRYNFGGYGGISVDLTDDFLIDGTARVENYSDFGSAFVWKISSRYKLMDDKLTVRGSASTGFRAPTLHQIYTQKNQYSFIPGQGIQVGGLVNNVSKEASILGLEALDPEKSTNITVGLGFKPSYNFKFTVDYYNIAVEDRVILGSEIGRTGLAGTPNATPLDIALDNANVSDLSFFTNAMDTRTSGLDFVASYRNIAVGGGTLGFNLSANYMISNEREGDVKNPDIVVAANAAANESQSVSNQTQEALFFTSRPEYKAILGIDFRIGKFAASLNNTLFGPTTFYQQGLADGLYTEFDPKVVTDLGLSYQVTEKITFAFNVNNLFNILPEWGFKDDGTEDGGAARLNDAAFMKNQSNLITFNQRYSQMTYDGYHFSQLGTMFNT
ncbi:MAG: iron complex outermembrane receptor protein, partial [Patescibacteria group bacterium]